MSGSSRRVGADILLRLAKGLADLVLRAERTEALDFADRNGRWYDGCMHDGFPTSKHSDWCSRNAANETTANSVYSKMDRSGLGNGNGVKSGYPSISTIVVGGHGLSGLILSLHVVEGDGSAGESLERWLDRLNLR